MDIVVLKMGSISLKDYLKRYETNTKEEKKKKEAEEEEKSTTNHWLISRG